MFYILLLLGVVIFFALYRPRSKVQGTENPAPIRQNVDIEMKLGEIVFDDNSDSFEIEVSVVVLVSREKYERTKSFVIRKDSVKGF